MSHDDACHHCGSPLDGSPYAVVLHGFSDDHRLALCTRCQGLRQAGQLPVDLLVQQWTYARSARVHATTAPEGLAGEAEAMLVRLDCLGCGAPFVEPGTGEGKRAALGELPSANRLPDGALSAECRICERVNVLERRGGQLVAVRVW
jgi:hypothetical protein